MADAMVVVRHQRSDVFHRGHMPEAGKEGTTQCGEHTDYYVCWWTYPRIAVLGGYRPCSKCWSTEEREELIAQAEEST